MAMLSFEASDRYDVLPTSTVGASVTAGVDELDDESGRELDDESGRELDDELEDGFEDEPGWLEDESELELLDDLTDDASEEDDHELRLDDADDPPPDS